MTTYQLAEKYHCHRQTIGNALKRHGVKVNKGKIDPDQGIQEIVRLYESGLKAREIAMRLGINSSTVTHHLNKSGVRMRTRWDY
jgi:DNA-binding CsgD family transcriptional regulator